jgi:hypothetical protein
MHLTKSDFKLGCTCPFKLKYHKKGYPNTLDEDPALAFFAEGGFMVEALAHAVLSVNPAVIFEHELESGRLRARIDAFEASDDRVVLTEIKAKSIRDADPDQFLTKKPRGVLGKWRPYMLDIAFQAHVAKLSFPTKIIEPRLCLVNASKTSGIEAIYEKINLVDDTALPYNRPRAVYTGDVDALREDHFLEFIDVHECVDLLMDEVQESVGRLLRFMDGEDPDVLPAKSLKPCKKCEYRGQLRPSGFLECWGSDAHEFHLLDLYGAGNGRKELKAEIAAHFEAGRYEITEVSDSGLEGDKPADAARRNQLESIRTGREVLRANLNDALRGLTYPIHFIDFEASRIPVPYVPGMKPYEVVLFQFSCHSIDSPDSPLVQHRQWLNLRDVYPNEEFVRELRSAIGDHGSVLMWSHYERTQLRDVKRQFVARHLDRGIIDWIEALAGTSKEQGDVADSQGRLIDLCALSISNYHHPAMNGSFSIKRVLPAIWSSAQHLWDDPWFAPWVRRGDHGRILEPYEALAQVVGSAGLGVASDEEEPGAPQSPVIDGIGAMRAYQEMLYGRERDNPRARTDRSDALLEYCKLDTMAMVMIWRHWQWLSKARAGVGGEDATV